MTAHLQTAYDLGCRYAAAMLEKTAMGEQLLLPFMKQTGEAAAKSGKGLLEHLKTPVGQYAAGGLGGAGLGALASDDENRLRGALMGAGLGLGAVGGGRAGIRTMTGKAPEKALARVSEGPGFLAHLEGAPGGPASPKMQDLAQRVLAGGGGGALLGGAAGLGGAAALAPEHREKSWTSKLRAMLPF